MKCDDCEKFPGVYPYYGIAPHKHELIDGKVFVTITLQEDDWPDNYDDCDNGAGLYYCPNDFCENGFLTAKKKAKLKLQFEKNHPDKAKLLKEIFGEHE